MSKDQKQNPALDVAKEVLQGNQDTTEDILLPSGVQIKILPVSATLLDEMSSRVVDPEPPMVYIEAKDREEPNPSDPEYIKQLEENERKRNVAAFDIMAMFGIELVGGLPSDDSWIKKLKMMERMGHIDLSSYNLDDELDIEFMYKRYIVLSAKLLSKIGSASGLSAEEVARAEDTFQSN